MPEELGRAKLPFNLQPSVGLSNLLLTLVVFAVQVSLGERLQTINRSNSY
jgi:hypothetical protein